ncbi:MAG: CvpA family protein [Betaproteobacteria bacterium]|nr:MAG: CvpA family protein [Betaproteobacteria bacterium]TMI20547.1 MAG: CvpA family protein [Betaproteobacteria bacterium]
MTWLDYVVIAVIVFSMAWGAWRGLVHEVLSLAGWIMAFIAGNLFAAPLSEMFPAAMRPELRVVVAFVLIFVGTLVLAALASALVTKFIKVSVLHSLNRWLGALFGLLRGLLIVVVLAMVAGLTSLPRKPDWTDSASGYSLAQTVTQLKPWLPPALAQRLRYH